MYTKPVSDIIQRHGLSHHSYADDTQMYMTMDHSNTDWRDGLARIELCVSEIREWMNQNMMKLNDDKTELIVCCYMFTILDYSSALEYNIIRRYTNIVYYKSLSWFCLNTIVC